MPFIGRYNLPVDCRDIDIAIKFRGDPQSRAGTMKNLAKMAKFLYSTKVKVLQNCTIIPARIPIIKARSCQGGFDIDISISNDDTGAKVAHLVGRHLRKHRFLRPILAVVKQYLDVTELNQVSTGGIGSFTLICLIIAYLVVRLSLYLSFRTLNAL